MLRTSLNSDIVSCVTGMVPKFKQKWSIDPKRLRYEWL